MQHLDAGHLLQHRGAQVVGRAGAGRRVSDLAGIGLRVGDELRHGIRRHGRVHHHRVGHVGEQRDRREILHTVERHVGDQRVVHRVHAHRVEQDGVAVGRRARDRAGADVARAAGAVLDDDRLAHRLVQMQRDDARQDVGRPARRPRHQQRDRAVRIGLREGRRGGEAASDGECGAAGEVGHGRDCSTRQRDSASAARPIPAQAGLQIASTISVAAMGPRLRGDDRALQRLRDLVQAHHVRHLLHLLLLLVGEPGEQRSGGPIEPLDGLVIDVDLAVAGLVRLHDLAERLQFGGDGGPVFFLLGGQRERGAHALDAGGAEHFAVIRRTLARRGGDRQRARLARDRAAHVGCGHRHRAARRGRRTWARQRHVHGALLVGQFSDRIAAERQRDGLDLDRGDLDRRRGGGGERVGDRRLGGRCGNRRGIDLRDAAARGRENQVEGGIRRNPKRQRTAHAHKRKHTDFGQFHGWSHAPPSSPKCGIRVNRELPDRASIRRLGGKSP